MTGEYKYTITGKKLPVILTAILTGLFGGLSVWTYKTDNSVSIVLFMFTILMFFAFILTVYHLLFFKVLIGLNGFYYQTHIGNGKFYNYDKVDKVWISSGKTQGGAKAQYCNISLINKEILRIPFLFADEKGVKYLIKKVNNYCLKSVKTEKDETYAIDGKTFGKSKLILGLLIVALIALSNIFIIRKFSFVVIPSIVICIFAIFLILNYNLWFKVKIEKDGFYCRTTPFNGRYYKYSEIKDCRIVEKVVKRHRYDTGTPITKSYYFFFVFYDTAGKKHVFQYEDQIHEHEINILKKRIDEAHV